MASKHSEILKIQGEISVEQSRPTPNQARLTQLRNRLAKLQSEVSMELPKPQMPTEKPLEIPEIITPEEKKFRELVQKETEAKAEEGAKREITSEEKTKIREGLDPKKEWLIDKEGNVTEFTEEEKKKRQFPPGVGRLTPEEKDKQILAEREQRKEGLLLKGQVGQYEQAGISPTSLDWGEAGIEGVVSGIPNALKWVGGAMAGGAFIGAGLGMTGGAAAPLTVPLGAVIGAVLGLGASISSSFISSLKSQRREITANQKIVLTDGKTNLQDSVTFAASNPAYRKQALERFNTQIRLIDKAYRQIQLDTTRDILKFESSEDAMGDFNVFYMPGGERDILVAEMDAAMAAPIDPEYAYRLAEMISRRGITLQGNK